MKHKLIVTTVTVATLGVASAYIAIDKASYDQDVMSLKEKAFTVSQITAEDKQFLDQVTSTWTISEVTPSDFMAEPLCSVGYDNNLSGLIGFYTHEPKPYSYFDQSRNKQEHKSSYTFHSHLTTSVDRHLYVGTDVAYHKLGEGSVEVYMDTDEGLKLTQYNKKLTLPNKTLHPTSDRVYAFQNLHYTHTLNSQTKLSGRVFGWCALR